ncbi:MAG: polyhydroxyalkanoate synthesis regulator DNA-binding domain-containing protein [Myxococcota bacterium]|nr:polyhydroxyalkanoate synthesis regulator DNA-binding domain-containing protein [Myxococcota bacterium]
MSILIKRYANRKLYNTETSRYITLKGIAELLDSGEEVRVLDNETGEDITKVALGQILVDTERTHVDAPENLLSQILGKGGDALYEALRKGVDDANVNFEEVQDRFKRFVRSEQSSDRKERAADGEGAEESGDRGRRGLSDWIAYTSPDVDEIVQNAVERVFKLLDLPRRSDIDALNENLQRVAKALEDLDPSWDDDVPPKVPPKNDNT